MAAAATTKSTFSHPGTAPVGSTTTRTHDVAAVPADIKWLLRTGDLFNCSTHGAGKAITGSASMARDLDGKVFARVGDSAACGATITSGDDTIQLS